MVGDSNVRGQRLVFVSRLVHIVVDAVKQSNLRVSFSEFLVVLVAIRERLVSTHLQFHHLVSLFIAF